MLTSAFHARTIHSSTFLTCACYDGTYSNLYNAA